MTYKNLIILKQANGSEFGVFSEHLPGVGTKLTLGGINKTVQVVRVGFVGESQPYSLSSTGGAETVTGPDRAALIPYLDVVDAEADDAPSDALNADLTVDQLLNVMTKAHRSAGGALSALDSPSLSSEDRHSAIEELRYAVNILGEYR